MNKKVKFDCHVHSDFSDGDYPIEQVFQAAYHAGLKGIVVTDHNLTQQLTISETLAKKFNLATVQGVEISCRYEGIDIHMLGFSKKFNVSRLNEGLQPIQAGYTERVKHIWAILVRKNITSIQFNQLLENKTSGVLFRYDLVKAVLAEGRYDKKTIQSMLGRGGQAYIPYGKWAFTPNQAVGLIHQAGGMAIIAHPGESLNRSDKNRDQTQLIILDLIDKLIARGLAGIEVFHTSHTPQFTTLLAGLAQKHRLVASGGSDYHGDLHHPEIRLGQTGLDELGWIKLKARLP